MTRIQLPNLGRFVRNKSKYLAKKYGGIWTYDGYISWSCDDGKRRVYRTHGPDMACDLSVDEYWLYEKDKPSERITWE